MDIGRGEHKTNIRLKTMNDFEGYLNARDFSFDSEDGTFFKLVTPQFNVVKQSAYAKGTNYMQEIVDYQA